MIHPYDEYYLDIAQSKLALMFEIAVYQEKMNIDDFSKKFIESEICQWLEKADPIYLVGKSAYELLELVLKRNIEGKEINMAASPEYWVGWVLAYTKVVYM